MQDALKALLIIGADEEIQYDAEKLLFLSLWYSIDFRNEYGKRIA